MPVVGEGDKGMQSFIVAIYVLENELKFCI
jgi:hypothetical protein